MTAERTTPAIERAAQALLDLDHGEHADMYAPRYSSARAILTAALSDPADPDWLARTLFVLYHGAGGAPAETALAWWTNETMSRGRWRRVADGLRMTLTGSDS